MKKFWRELCRLSREFVSRNDDVVDRKTIFVMGLILFLATPVMILCFAVIYRHIWTLGKPLDGPVVNLLIAMLGASTGGLGTALVSRFIGPPRPGLGPGMMPPKEKPAPPETKLSGS